MCYFHICICWIWTYIAERWETEQKHDGLSPFSELINVPSSPNGGTLQENCIIIISPIPGKLQGSLWCYWYSVPQCKPLQCSIIPELPVCQVRKWPCCSDETNIHRNVVFLLGVNLSCPSSTCTSYRRPWELPLGSRGHCGYRKKKEITEMDSCIK